jgi:AraC-like DNA-binding protein
VKVTSRGSIVTVAQLVQEARLAQAAYLLRNTRKNVSDIAVSVGYENISYFHRIFADTYGKSHKRYRDEK